MLHGNLIYLIEHNGLHSNCTRPTFTILAAAVVAPPESGAVIRLVSVGGVTSVWTFRSLPRTGVEVRESSIAKNNKFVKITIKITIILK